MQRVTGEASIRMPGWRERLLVAQAPCLPRHRHRWFARDLQQFLGYCCSRRRDKLDVQLLASEYLETLRHSELPSRLGRSSRPARLSMVVCTRCRGMAMGTRSRKRRVGSRFRIRSATESRADASGKDLGSGVPGRRDVRLGIFAHFFICFPASAYSGDCPGVAKNPAVWSLPLLARAKIIRSSRSGHPTFG
jgi:hypothetical protein